MGRSSVYKVLVILFSYLTKHKFYSCGSNFRIHFPAIINSPQRIEIGYNVTIACHSLLNCVENSKNEVALRIGDGCSFGRFVHINAYEKVVLEDYVLVGERVHISDASHIYSDSQIPIIQQGAAYLGAVVIKKGVWIGSGAVILPNVTIGRNAVVGANAVVASDVPDNHVARGVPARMFKKLEKDESFQ